MKKLALLLVALLLSLTLTTALAEAAEAPALPAAVPAESMEDFIGDWELSGAALMGIYMTAEQIGINAQVQISEDKLSITFEEDFGESACELLEDGTLQYTDEDPDGTAGLFILNDDGSISTSMDTPVGDEVYSITMYFTRIAEPEA